MTKRKRTRVGGPQSRSDRALSTTDRLPMTCTVMDVCRALNIGRTRFYELLNANRLPIPEIRPRLTRGPRFRGVDVQLYLEGHYATRKAG